MRYPTLLVLRHGQTEWNADERFQGRLDSGLTELGRAQALDQRKILSCEDLAGFDFRCSPQGRAFVTAGIALDGIAALIETDERLREIDVGEWSGRRRADISVPFDTTESPDGALEYYEYAPGGEGFAKLRLRCQEFLSDLNGPCVIVTHGITSRMLRLVALGRPNADIALLPGGQGIVHRVAEGQHDTLVPPKA